MSERCTKTEDGMHVVRENRVDNLNETVVFRLCEACGKRRTRIEQHDPRLALF